MTIRRRAFLIMFGTGLVLLGIILAAGRSVILAGAEGIEREMALHDLGRIRDALAADTARLAATAADWAAWDETYAFAGAPGPAFVAEHVSLAAFRNLDVDLVLVADPAGEVLCLKAFDFERGAESPETAAAFASRHARDPGLLLLPDGGTPRRGILVLAERAFLVAAQAVRRSDGSGPSRGTLLFARRLDAAAQARLAGLTHLEASTVLLADPALPESLRTLAAGPGALSGAVETVAPDRIAAAAILPDLSGRAGLVLRTVHPRVVRAQADRALRYFLLALLAAGTAFGVLGVVLLERQVLMPLSALGDGVREIGRDRDLARRLPAAGNDELSALAAEVNGMLEQIQASETGLRTAREELAGRVREQALTESALRRSEELLRLVLESADELIFMQDLEGRCLYYNASRRLQTGEEAVDQTACEVLDAGLGRAMFEGVQAVAATGRAQTGEIAVDHAGERKWFRRSHSPVLDAAGGVTAVVTIAHEVTAEKELHERISRGKREWERTFDAVQDLILLVDDRFRIARVNRALAERLGATPQELIGRACHEVLHRGLGPAASCPFRAPAEEEKPMTTEMHVEALNGFFRVGAYPVRDEEGRLTGAVHVATDLTERRKAEEELRRVNLMNQDILQRAPFGVFVVRATGEVEYVNPAMVRISGATEEEFRSANILELESYRRLGLAERIRGAAEGTPFFLGPVEHVSHFRGKRTTRNFTGFPLDLGREKKALIFVEDLTELKKMEGALRTVTEEISALAGQAFFEEIVLTLSTVLGADAVLVGKLPAESPEEARVMAACIDGRIADRFVYRLAGTPCEGILGRGVCRHAEGVGARFPRDPLLARLGAESYIGIPLFASDGRVSGLMAALWRRPLPDGPFAESLLKVFALRVATEIERAQAEETLRRTSSLLRTIVLASPLPIVAVDAGKAVRIWNPAAERLFGWSAEEAIGVPAAGEGRERWGEFLQLLDPGGSRGEPSPVSPGAGTAPWSRSTSGPRPSTSRRRRARCASSSSRTARRPGGSSSSSSGHSAWRSSASWRPAWRTRSATRSTPSWRSATPWPRTSPPTPSTSPSSSTSGPRSTAWRPSWRSCSPSGGRSPRSASPSFPWRPSAARRPRSG